MEKQKTKEANEKDGMKSLEALLAWDRDMVARTHDSNYPLFADLRRKGAISANSAWLSRMHRAAVLRELAGDDEKDYWRKIWWDENTGKLPEYRRAMALYLEAGDQSAVARVKLKMEEAECAHYKKERALGHRIVKFLKRCLDA